MGAAHTCDSTIANVDAMSTPNSDKQYRWYGFHVLSADCKDATTGSIAYRKSLNWYLIISIILVSLFILSLLFRSSGAQVRFS